MALEYKSNTGLEPVGPVLDELVIWYGQVMRAYFERRASLPPFPGILQEWLDKALLNGTISESLSLRAGKQRDDLSEAAGKFIAKVGLKDVMPSGEFNEITRHYEEYVQFLRFIERDQALENSGIDEKTGLRSVKVMRDDITREMDRRSRRGNPFALALLKINHFSPAWSAEDELFTKTIRKIADQMRLSLRTFDDAYYLGDEYFLLSLKHADKLGSQAAVGRLISSVNEGKVMRPDKPEEQISVSIVVAEPSPGDKLDDMLAHMKKDLEGVDSKSTVLQYNDISPLQRYLHTIKTE